MTAPRRAVYLTHPEVEIDPVVPVPDWGLSDAGVARATALARRLGQLDNTQVVSSAERKAVALGELLAVRSGRPLAVTPAMHENDRTATGFLPGPEFEATADAFFADPDRSVCGWETARDAQARIVAQVQAALARYAPAHLVFCGHGAVGSLLYCHLAGVPIDRRWDQPGPGHWFAFDIATGTPAGHWRPMETLTAM